MSWHERFKLWPIKQTLKLTNSFCDCGDRKETSEHYIIHCPCFTPIRQNIIFKLPANLLNITTLLQGDPNIPNSMNSLIFKAVQNLIAQSGHFAMEWQTQLNNYWHKSIFSCSFSLCLDFCCCFHVNIIIHTHCCKINLVNYVCEHLLFITSSLFNIHTTILIVHIFMNVNKLCLNQVYSMPWLSNALGCTLTEVCVYSGWTTSRIYLLKMKHSMLSR